MDANSLPCPQDRPSYFLHLPINWPAKFDPKPLYLQTLIDAQIDSSIPFNTGLISGDSYITFL